MNKDAVKKQMISAVKALAEDVHSLRVGKATPSLIEEVIVPAYGGTQELKVMEMASITATDGQTLVVNPWDKSVIGEIAKAVNAAGLGVSAAIDGEILRVTVPPVTEERRKEMQKLLGTKVEQGRVTVRQIRHDQLHEIKKQFENKELNEDEKFIAEKELQEITDEYNKKIDEIFQAKEEELMTV